MNDNPSPWHFMGIDFDTEAEMNRAMYEAGVPAFFVTFGLGDFARLDEAGRRVTGAYATVVARDEIHARQVIVQRRGNHFAFIYPIAQLEQHLDNGWLNFGEVEL